MTITEYYNLPEGTNITFKYSSSFYDTVDGIYPCHSDMSYAFANNPLRTVVKKLNTSNVTNMKGVFESGSQFTGVGIEDWDTSNVTDMSRLFYGCSSFVSITLPNWDTSNVTSMDSMFASCSKLREVDFFNWDTSNVTSMDSMFASCSALQSVGSIICSGLSAKNKYPFKYYSNNTNLTELGGFVNAKMSWDDNYGLSKLPNLTYESCINVLNGLYDFNGNGVTPTSNQGKLKVHSNFVTLVGDEISIGTNKGWTITT